MYKRLLVTAVAIIATATLPSLPARAADGLHVVSSFSSSNAKLVVADYAVGAEVIGIIGITTPSQTFTYSFVKSDLNTLLGLWEKARHADAQKYVASGSMAETETHALDVLLLAGGPTVRISIADPVDGLGSFDLSRGDYSAFDSALNKAAAAVTN